ncbi:MAG: radical SAM protein [Deltaproteobacteria bacterium]|nr:radical SAM protein [Deltaproteobacteria bacterium]
MTQIRHVYGPVCSRRLGRSLGIDLVPYKICSYDCIYCQLGRTTNLTLERREYVPIAAVLEELRAQLAAVPAPDYITLAGSGEPTLNSGLGQLIEGIRELTEIPLAVLTNGSLLWMPEVRAELIKADLVVPSLDAGDEALFHHVNRPHPSLSFATMIDGLVKFRREFSGRIWLEIFLLGGVTGILYEVDKIAALVDRMQPDRVQLNTVARPPAEEYAFAVNREKLHSFSKRFSVPTDVVSEGVQDRIVSLSAPQEGELLTLLSRRPCPLSEIAAGLGRAPNEVLKLLEKMMQQKLIAAIFKNGRYFYQTVRS